MTSYCIAADFKTETINGYTQLNRKYSGQSRVDETYGQITCDSIFPGGRIAKDLPEIDMKALAKYVEYSANRNIGFNYSLNGSCTWNREFTKSGLRDLVGFIKELEKIGVKGITVSAPSLIEIIQDTAPNMEIKVSIINQVNTVNKRRQYRLLGVHRVVLDEAIVRDFRLLMNIAAEGPVELIANSLCSKDCIYRLHHYNQTAHDSIINDEQRIQTYYNHKCMLARSLDIAGMLKLGWIRPEDIHYYDAIGIHNFKLQGRHTVYYGDPVRAVECYMKGEYDGNLIDLLELFNSPYHFKVALDNAKLRDFIKPFLNKSFCKSDCDTCRYCLNYINRNFSVADFKDMNGMARQFYENYNELHSVLQEI